MFVSHGFWNWEKEEKAKGHSTSVNLIDPGLPLVP